MLDKAYLKQMSKIQKDELKLIEPEVEELSKGLHQKNFFDSRLKYLDRLKSRYNLNDPGDLSAIDEMHAAQIESSRQGCLDRLDKINGHLDHHVKEARKKFPENACAFYTKGQLLAIGKAAPYSHFFALSKYKVERMPVATEIIGK